MKHGAGVGRPGRRPFPFRNRHGFVSRKPYEFGSLRTAVFSTAMTHVIETVTPRNGLARWRAVAGCVAAAAAIAAGCGKARHTYPTISAVNPDGGNVNVRGTYNHCPQLIFV